MDPRLNAEDKAWRDRARIAAAGVRDAAATIDEQAAASRDLLRRLGDEGVFEAGSAATGGALQIALVSEELGAASASVGATVVSHLVATAMVARLAADDDAELITALVSGTTLAAVAFDGGATLLDVPGIGGQADAQGLVSGAAAAVLGATCAGVFVVPYDDEGSAAVAVVDRDAVGMEIGDEVAKLGLNGSGMARLVFEAVTPSATFTDAAATIEMAADWARIGNAAVSVGICAEALAISRRHVLSSDQGLDKAQSVQWMLADIATEAEAARLLGWYAASRIDSSERREAAAMARLVAAEAAVASSRRAVQIMGAEGNERGAGVERLYRDAKAMEVHQGASEAQRLAVARELLPDLFEASSG